MKSYLVLTLLAALQSLASLDICKYNHNGWPFCLILLLVPHVVWDDLEYKQWELWNKLLLFIWCCSMWISPCLTLLLIFFFLLNLLEFDEPLLTLICVVEISWIAGWGRTFFHWVRQEQPSVVWTTFLFKTCQLF